MYFLIQIKSNQIDREKKRVLLIPMEVDNQEWKEVGKRAAHEKMINDARQMFPQYTKSEDNPLFTVIKATKKEIELFCKEGRYVQKVRRVDR